jgi:molybdopterin-guanine dinucleotide biosynthesis protein A
MGGADKAFLMLGGRPLVAHSVARLAPQVEAVAISANGDPARFAAFGLPVLPDAGTAGEGPLAGVLSGLSWAKGVGADALVTVAVDTPFFPGDLVARLVAAGGDGVAMAADATGAHPTFALWPVRRAADLSATFAQGTRSVAAGAEALGVVAVRFDAGADAFFNVNTPSDLSEAARRSDA